MRFRSFHDPSLSPPGSTPLEILCGERPRLLLAYPDPRERRRIRRLLEGDGCDVTETSNGAQTVTELAACTLMHRPLPKAIVASVHLDGWDGLELTGGLRDTDWNVPIVLIADSMAEPGVRVRAMREGAAAVFERSFDPNDFRTALLHVLRRARACPDTSDLAVEAVDVAEPPSRVFLTRQGETPPG